MPKLRDVRGALWQAQQQGAFPVDRILEPQVEFRENRTARATAKLMEILPGKQFVALMRWARGLRPMKLEAA